MAEKKDIPVDDSKYSMDTRVIYGKNQSPKWDFEHHVTPPMSSSTTFRLDNVERGALGFMQFAHTLEYDQETPPIYIYDRLGEPNKDILEENLAYVENGETAVTFATGMAAISAILGVLAKNGDEILGHRTLYGCTISLFQNWLPRYGVEVTKVDLTKIDELAEKISEKTKVVYFETPSNPNLAMIDINEVSKVVKKVNESREEENYLRIVVDNTFSTSYCQRPIEHGADFVVHSLTKGIGGFGTDMGGVVVGPKKFRDILLLYRKDFGGILNPKPAWSILTYGLPTLPLRQKQMIKTASKLAEFLDQHPKIQKVNYPGLPSFEGHEIAKKQMLDFDGNFAPGGLFYFVVKGENPAQSKELGSKLMDYIAEKSYTMTLAVSLGHTRTLIEHPASMTHSVVPPEKLEEYGIDPGGIRIAVGLEKDEDILHDLEKALQII